MDPSLVEIPYLSPDAIELLLNCCTRLECDLWRSLGDNWRKSVKVRLFCIMKKFTMII